MILTILLNLHVVNPQRCLRDSALRLRCIDTTTPLNWRN